MTTRTGRAANALFRLMTERDGTSVEWLGGFEGRRRMGKRPAHPIDLPTDLAGFGMATALAEV